MTDTGTPTTGDDQDTDGPRLVQHYGERPERLRPLLALWDTSADELFARLEGVDDEEWTWEPAPGTFSVRRQGDGWRHDPPGGFGGPPSLRAIAWTAGHLAELGLLRADWTTGRHALQPDDLAWPGTAAEGVAFLREGLDAWRAALDRVDDADLDTVGRCAFPHGLDPHLPLLDIVWWNTRELVHHAADLMTVRDLYSARS